MKRKFKYDPEDLESLMLNKTFGELYPEEKEFVLKHMDSPEEYASMRETLLAIVSEADAGTLIKPKSATKRKLMSEFQTERSNNVAIWLNSFFGSFQRKPALAFGSLATVLIIISAVFVFYPDNEKVILAEQITRKEANENRELKKEPGATTEETEAEEELDMENLEENNDEAAGSQELQILKEETETTIEVETIFHDQMPATNDNPEKAENLSTEEDFSGEIPKPAEMKVAEQKSIADNVHENQPHADSVKANRLADSPAVDATPANSIKATGNLLDDLYTSM